MTDIQQGQDCDISFTLSFGTTAVNLTGASAAVFRIYSAPGGAESSAIATKTLGSGVTVTDATAGKIKARLSATETFLLPTCVTYLYGQIVNAGQGYAWGDLVVTTSAGDVIRTPVQKFRVLAAAAKP